MKKYQLENPNNCRVKIEFNKKNNPVTFEYVGTDSAFNLCFRFWRRFMFFNGLLIFVFIFGIIMGILWEHRQDPKYAILWFVMLLLYWIIAYGIPGVLALIFSNTRLIKTMPYLWNLGRTKFYADFKPEDIKDNKIEIPLYSNVFLQYEMSEDFSKYIDKIDIVEHPFNIIVRKGWKKRELKRNEFLWKATFYFNGKIKKGLLKTEFH